MTTFVQRGKRRGKQRLEDFKRQGQNCIRSGSHLGRPPPNTQDAHSTLAAILQFLVRAVRADGPEPGGRGLNSS